MGAIIVTIMIIIIMITIRIVCNVNLPLITPPLIDS